MPVFDTNVDDISEQLTPDCVAFSIKEEDALKEEVVDVVEVKMESVPGAALDENNIVENCIEDIRMDQVRNCRRT